MIFLNLFAFAMRVLSINFLHPYFYKKHSTETLYNYLFFCCSDKLFLWNRLMLFMNFYAKKAFSNSDESRLIQTISQLISIDLIYCFFSTLSEEVFDWFYLKQSADFSDKFQLISVTTSERICLCFSTQKIDDKTFR